MAKRFELNTALDCCICDEILLDPRALPCGHSYCGPPRDCLKILEKGNILVCAICRSSHNIKAADVKPLYGIRDFLQQQDPTNSTRLNEVVNGSVCKFHTGITCNLWCTNCDVMICNLCLGDDHDGHTVRNFRRYLEDRLKIKVAKSFRNDLRSYYQEADSNINRCNERIKSLRSELLKWEECLKNTTDKKKLISRWMTSLSGNSSFENVDVSSILIFLKDDLRLPELPVCSSKLVTPQNTGNYYQSIPNLSVVMETPSHVVNKSSNVSEICNSSDCFENVEGIINIATKLNKVEPQQPNRFIFGHYVFRVGCSLQNDPPWIGEKLLIEIRASLQPAKKATRFEQNGCVDVEVALTNQIYPARSFKSKRITWAYTEKNELEVFTLNYANLRNLKNMWLKAGDILEVQISFSSSDSH